MLAISSIAAEAADPSGWRSLFDGHSLAGWRSLKSTAPGSGWKAVDGEIRRVAKSGDLLTVDEFGDFELELEWKIERAGNSGVIYRVGLGESTTYRTGPEYQLLDNAAASDNKDPKHLAGSIYDLVAPATDATKPVGEWNQTRIRVVGWKIEHWLNGKKVAEADFGTAAGHELILHSKFKEMPHFASLRRGRIALQDHDGDISFRNIRLRGVGAPSLSP